MLQKQLLLLLLQGAAAALVGPGACAGDSCDDSAALLTIPRQSITADRVRASTKGEPFTLAGKSIYFLVIDRFAKSGEHSEDYSYCKKQADWSKNQNLGGGYCGGSIKGITSDSS
eukprot:Skav200680  [mRNA]  locus=scaffold1446:160540:165033:+ [translate_table: standard]